MARSRSDPQVARRGSAARSARRSSSTPSSSASGAMPCASATRARRAIPAQAGLPSGRAGPSSSALWMLATKFRRRLRLGLPWRNGTAIPQRRCAPSACSSGRIPSRTAGIAAGSRIRPRARRSRSRRISVLRAAGSPGARSTAAIASASERTCPAGTARSMSSSPVTCSSRSSRSWPTNATLPSSRSLNLSERPTRRASSAPLVPVAAHHARSRSASGPWLGAGPLRSVSASRPVWRASAWIVASDGRRSPARMRPPRW
jgi:hypothetical protein